MKRMLAASLLLSFPAIAMHQEPVAPSQNKGREGFLQDALSLVASPMAKITEKLAVEAVAKPLVEYEKHLVADIVAGVAAANKTELEALKKEIAELRAEVKKQNEGCCVLQ